jgi:hypothetical protein
MLAIYFEKLISMHFVAMQSSLHIEHKIALIRLIFYTYKIFFDFREKTFKQFRAAVLRLRLNQNDTG